MDELDLVIRNATVVDGTGKAPFVADIGIAGGWIVQVGSQISRGRQEIDADGKLATPGFVDIHTHYDSQVTWSSRLDPSSLLGVTTVVMGNCGVGFAPCRPDDRDTLIRLMEGVEDIPEAVMAEGLKWNWLSFPDYLDALEGNHYDIDVATQVAHAPLRVFVMGQRGIDRESATADDRRAMARLAAEGIRAGALGFSTSRTIFHKTSDGRQTPMFDAAEEELLAIAQAIGATGEGAMELVSDFDDARADCRLCEKIAKESGLQVSMALTQREDRPERWREVLAQVDAANRDGAALRVQVGTRGIGVMMGLELTRHPFSWQPSYRAIAHLPMPERLAAMRDPQLRRRILTEAPVDAAERARNLNYERTFPVADVPDYEPQSTDSLAAMARDRGVPPDEFTYDLLTAGDGKRLLYRPLHNYVADDLDVVLAMLRSPYSLIGLGDGGAHCGVIADASFTPFMLTHWARDRSRGARMALPEAVRLVTSATARAVNLFDRGVIAPGYKADLNIIDFERLRLLAPEVVYDMPLRGRRLVQRAEGIVATIVSGSVIARNGTATGALPGRLIRGAKPAPAASSAAR
jgi:N-acyl-D-aspartate/D-glutamate deacylase